MQKDSDHVISGFIAAINQRYTSVAPPDLYHGNQNLKEDHQKHFSL